ncbi:hypothetical protein CIHG_02564 [Coccidioides immitis H538.4]|uniref:Uncharacterized protein n=2 Tax=Coccidioides immitis TaxID=5501 RepID=A0A0J8RJE0_COCIT|nr:hypothetical protein CIRG_02896 [Coccidioides immitis RMSCC 2394]KMU84781.1 hypothetical protein CIHG_02564 [Coccidioides immitis H538.4]
MALGHDKCRPFHDNSLHAGSQIVKQQRSIVCLPHGIQACFSTELAGPPSPWAVKAPKIAQPLGGEGSRQILAEGGQDKVERYIARDKRRPETLMTRQREERGKKGGGLFRD